MKIGRVTISDRASAGVYADHSGPEIEIILRECLAILVPAIREGIAHLRGEDPHPPAIWTLPTHECNLLSRGPSPDIEELAHGRGREDAQVA